jgi:hypothetical protein
LSKLKIKLGLKDDIEAKLVDQETRLEELGIDRTGEKGQVKWGEEETISTDPDFDGHTPSDDEYIDPQFFHLDFKINGKVFRMAVDHILRIKHEELTDPTLETFNSQLEACSYYRFSFFAGAQQVAIRRKDLERAFRRWLAERNEAHRKMLSISRKEERQKHKLNSRDQPGITKDEILDSILLDLEDGPQYESFQHEINVLRQKEDLLLELRDALHDRGFHLGGIADRMSQQKRRQEF